MAGVKGKSGGPRPNSGGKRPGAGRPRKPPVKIEEGKDMLALLQDIALGKTDATLIQVRAAIAAVQYTHTKASDAGKKGKRKDAANAVVEGGRFKPAEPPKLHSVN